MRRGLATGGEFVLEAKLDEIGNKGVVAEAPRTQDIVASRLRGFTHSKKTRRKKMQQQLEERRE